VRESRDESERERVVETCRRDESFGAPARDLSFGAPALLVVGWTNLPVSCTNLHCLCHCLCVRVRLQEFVEGALHSHVLGALHTHVLTLI